MLRVGYWRCLDEGGGGGGRWLFVCGTHSTHKSALLSKCLECMLLSCCLRDVECAFTGSLTCPSPPDGYHLGGT